LVLHGAALLLVARLAHWPLWWAAALLAAFSLPALLRHAWRAEALAPLALLYATAGLRLAWVYGLRRPVPPAFGYEWSLALSAAWSLIIALRSAGRLWLAWPLAGVAFASVFSWQLWRLAPAGVTGADPYAYVQMALDLVRRGTPLHRFALAPLAQSLGLSTLPVTHVGYVLPDAAGWAPTVWPPGYSALLALAYRLGGEGLLLGANAWVGLASLALTAALAWRLAPDRQYAPAIAAAAVAVLATSPEQWVRLAVPLADGATQLFTTAAIVLALLIATPPHSVVVGAGRWTSRDVVRHSSFVSRSGPSSVVRRLSSNPTAPLFLLIGLALGAAFATRYTQALIAPGLIVVAAGMLQDRRQRWSFVLALALGALLTAAPDLLYRTRLYGAPWRFGTGELALFHVAAVPGAARQLASELLRPAEFGWLSVLALVGAAQAWRTRRAGLALVVAAYGPVLAFHLFYPFVRLRDVLFALAPLAAFSGLGLVAAAAWLLRRGSLARLAVIMGVLVLGAARLAPLLARAPGFFTSGGLLPEQRQALETLAAVTEPTAVVACSLNSGAVELYSGRLTVRPGRVLQPHAAWPEEQWLTFVEALRAQGRPLYILMDSPELDAPLAELEARYAFKHVADLYLPVFVHTGGSENQVVALWRVDW
jgi:hypothetical protein